MLILGRTIVPFEYLPDAETDTFAAHREVVLSRSAPEISALLRHMKYATHAQFNDERSLQCLFLDALPPLTNRTVSESGLKILGRHGQTHE